MSKHLKTNKKSELLEDEGEYLYLQINYHDTQASHSAKDK